MHVTIRELTGRDTSLEITMETTISDLKRMIENKLELPVQEQRLLVSGSFLEDDLKVSDYFIGNDSVIDLLRACGQNMEVFIKRGDGHSVPLKVESTYKVSGLKVLIHNRVGCPPIKQKLTFDEEMLSDNQQDLAYYRVKSGSIIRLDII